MSDRVNVDDSPVEQSVWARLGHLVVQLSLVAAAAIAVGDGDASVRTKLAAVGLASLLLGWHALMAYRWHYWQLPPVLFAGSMIVAAGLWMPLLIIHPAFALTVLGAYVVAACPFLTRAIVSVGVLTGMILVIGTVESGGLALGEIVRIVLTGAAVVVLHGVVGHLHQQNERRRQLIERLQSSQAELARREREAATVAERERLARDIHDSLAQGFTSIIMLLEAADAQLDRDAVDVRARIDQARQAARDNLAEARRVVWSLRPEPLESGGLARALRLLVETSATAAGLDGEFRIDGELGPLRPDQEVALYRATQEALANVAKHAHARRVVCSLAWLEDEVILDVNDDGEGFDPDATIPEPGAGGLGLIGLHERVTRAGGELHIDSTRGAGTTITVTMPLQTAAEAHPADADTPP